MQTRFVALVPFLAIKHAFPNSRAMTDAERELLYALAWMCEQYLERDGVLDHEFMSAGEGAVDLLFRYDLLDPSDRGPVWTQAGKALLSNSNREPEHP